MQKWIKQLFSKQALFIAWLPTIIVGLIFVILNRTVPQFSAKNIIVGFAQLLFKILIISVPVWLLLAVILVAFILYRIKRVTLNEREKFVLCIVDEREVGHMTLNLVYKKRWPNESRIMTKCSKILERLERLNLDRIGMPSR